MKWGEHSTEAGDKLTEVIANFFGAKGLSILVGVATFAFLISAISKWS